MSKKYKKGTLGYNFENDRYGILDFDLWVDEGLHCGEGIEIFINGKWKADRIEMKFGGTWYLVESGIQGDDLEGLKVRY